MPPEFGVVAVLGDELVVPAGLDDAALLEHDDLIGAPDGGEAVGNHEHRAALHEALERELDFAFGDGIDAGSGFVEDDEGRVLQERPGDGDALLFALAEADAFFADISIELLGQGGDEIPGAGLPQGARDFVLGGVFPGEKQVVTHGAFEEERVLRDMTDSGAQLGQRDIADIDAIEPEGAVAYIVAAHGEVGDGRFTGASMTDESGHLVRFDSEAESLEHRGTAGVGEADALEVHLYRLIWKGAGALRLVHFELGVEHFKDAVAGGATSGEEVVESVQLRNGHVEHVGEQEEGDELAHGEVAGVAQHEVAADRDDAEKAHLGDEGGGWAVIGPAIHGSEGLFAQVLSAPLESGGLAALESEGVDQAVALDVFDEEAVELSCAVAHAFPDFPGAPGVEDSCGEEDGDGKEDEPGEEGLHVEERGCDHDDSDERGGALLGAVEEGALDGGDIFNDAGRNFAAFTLVVKGNGQAEELGMEVAPHLEEHALLEGVIDSDAQPVEQLAARVKGGNEGDA